MLLHTTPYGKEGPESTVELKKVMCEWPVTITGMQALYDVCTDYYIKCILCSPSCHSQHMVSLASDFSPGSESNLALVQEQL